MRGKREVVSLDLGAQLELYAEFVFGAFGFVLVEESALEMQEREQLVFSSIHAYQSRNRNLPLSLCVMLQFQVV